MSVPTPAVAVRRAGIGKRAGKRLELRWPIPDARCALPATIGAAEA